MHGTVKRSQVLLIVVDPRAGTPKVPSGFIMTTVHDEELFVHGHRLKDKVVVITGSSAFVRSIIAFG